MGVRIERNKVSLYIDVCVCVCIHVHKCVHVGACVHMSLGVVQQSVKTSVFMKRGNWYSSDL